MKRLLELSQKLSQLEELKLGKLRDRHDELDLSAREALEFVNAGIDSHWSLDRAIGKAANLKDRRLEAEVDLDRGFFAAAQCRAQSRGIEQRLTQGLQQIERNEEEKGREDAGELSVADRAARQRQGR